MQPVPPVTVSDVEAGYSEHDRPTGAAVGAQDHHLLFAEQNVPLRGESDRSRWPLCVHDFSPVLVSRNEAVKLMMQLEKNFSKQTNVRVIGRQSNESTHLQELILQDRHSPAFRELLDNGPLLACFVNRFIIRPNASLSDIPRDKKRLRISGAVFRWLLAIFDAPPSFISSLLSVDIPLGFCEKSFKGRRGGDAYACWYTIPIRTAAACLDEDGSHVLSVAGSNQMDPTGYLHLSDTGNDIRPSRIGIYCRYDGKQAATICFDFQDGRLHDVAGEPYTRVKEVVQNSWETKGDMDPLDMHATFFSLSVRWWRQVVSQLKRQLLHLETRLLGEATARSENIGDAESVAQSLGLKKSLHAIVSHLGRYMTELEATLATLLAIEASETHIWAVRNSSSLGEEGLGRRTNSHLRALAQQFSALRTCVQELKMKAGTVLELLALVVTWKNDMRILRYGNSTRKLLRSSRAQAKASQGMMRESHKMARDTRIDSVSMKTIALLTMAFLPATSFAAILAMPFFADLPWLTHPATIWVWVVLTVPTTAISAVIYLLSTRKELKSIENIPESHEEDELESIDIELDE